MEVSYGSVSYTHLDGCNPIQIFFKVVFPILKPTMISTAILETMWVWNDYLLPTLVLDIKKYRTIPMAIQYFRGGYGRVELALSLIHICHRRCCRCSGPALP